VTDLRLPESTWSRCRPDRASARAVLSVAWPLMLSNGLWTAQITLDRVLLSRYDAAAVGAAMAAALLFWTPLNLFYYTAIYASTFVSQYLGAGQPQRTGPAVWQAIHFSILGGLAFLALVPLAGPLIDLVGHDPELRDLETTYLRILCFSALPTLLTGATTSFFTGRGESRTVLLISTFSLTVNGVLAYGWIFGKWGFPQLGIAGAGWATVAGMSSSALLGLALMLRRQHRLDFATLSGWRPDADLFRRLLRFGVPSGIFVALDTLSFTLFTLFVGRLGTAELSATTIAFTLNLVVYMPVVGMGQAVAVLVGRHQGEERPDRSERVTWTGVWLGLGLTASVGLVYVVLPQTLADLFRSEGEAWDQVGPLVPVLLRFVVLYCLFDCVNVIVSSALRGAGDTRFVSLTALLLSWPIMVLPTWAATEAKWSLLWPWSFASSYVMVLTFVFLWRFLWGRWRTMKVIEAEAPALELPEATFGPGSVRTAEEMTGVSVTPKE
jgi:MATE family multidrug resistance protein